MLIREANSGDLHQMMELCELHAEYEQSECSMEGKKDRLRNHLFGDHATTHCLVVAEAEKLQGYATFMKQFSTWDAEEYVYLDCLYLREEIRGKGVGRELMQRVKAFAEQEGCSHVQWQTPDFNENAIKFYKKLGATSKAKERFFWY